MRSGSISRAARCSVSSTEGDYPARVEATQDRAEALRDADFVLITILASPLARLAKRYRDPQTYGVDTNIGDTRGPSGIFRALRTIPVMLDIARDIERYCPAAYVLNYTNPMVMLCRAIEHGDPGQPGWALPQRATDVGDAGEMDWRADGGGDVHLRRHQPPGLVLDLQWKGEDAYPLIQEAVTGRPRSTTRNRCETSSSWHWGTT